MTTIPPSDPEKVKDRVITLRVALLGLVAVLLSGLIGAAAAFLTARVQIDSQAKQDRLDFLRGQQQAAYTKLASDEQLKVGYFLDCAANAVLLARTSVTPKMLSEAHSTSEALADLIAGDAVAVQFVGSQRTAKAAESLASDFRDLATGCYEITGTRLPGLLDNKQTVTVESDMEAAIKKELADYAIFVGLGRADLQG